MITVAIPLEFVKAVPVLGVSVTNAASVLKVTTALGTGAPAASRTVAFAVVGPLLVTDVTVTPAESVNAINNFGAVAVVVGVPPAAVVVVPPATVPPSPQAASNANVVTDKSIAKNL